MTLNQASLFSALGSILAGLSHSVFLDVSGFPLCLLFSPQFGLFPGRRLCALNQELFDKSKWQAIKELREDLTFLLQNAYSKYQTDG